MSENKVIELKPQMPADIEQGAPVADIDNTGEPVSEIEDAEQYKKPEQTAEPQFNSMDEALAYQLYTRIMEIKDKKREELGEYCITDRFNSADFITAFRDAMNSYRDDVVICERLYKRNSCVPDTKQVYDLPEAAKAITDEFRQYVTSIDWGTLSDENREGINVKIKEYQDKLATDEMKPVLIDIPTEVYVDSTGKKLLMTPLVDCVDENLQQHCLVIARFILAYFLTMRFTINSNFNVNITPVQSGDYIDIIALIKLIK